MPAATSARVSIRIAPAPRLRRGGRMTVRPGDTLWSIAQRVLGPGARDAAVAREVDRLWRLNAHRHGLTDPDLIWPGLELDL
jgi:resuscitation-promoting factor RpfA